jgi:sugar fermentation stimulation protein A
MFPDTVTERGRRHLMELAKQARRADSAVLFLVHTSGVCWFMPDYHTDLAFSRTFLKVKDRIRILAVGLDWRPDLTPARKVRSLEIPWPYLQREIRDRGAYILLLKLDRRKRIQVGKLGDCTFRRGYYLYVGSAMNNLSARIARHARLRKKLHWHIDYLRQEARYVAGLPIRSSKRLECVIAQALSERFVGGPSRFGSSDCRCGTHLFFSDSNPLEQPAFDGVLQRFRMRTPD